MTTRTLDTADLKDRVQQMYREVATQPDKEFHFETGRAPAEHVGYPSSDLDAIPEEAIKSFAGVGYFFDLAAIQPGERVLDLGSGSGMDSFLAARAAGDHGKVIGIDMTDEQLDKAARLATASGTTNVEFRRGYMENSPVDDADFDVAISNGVFNLAPDKAAVFADVARVLKPGGRLALADIVTDSQLPEGVTCDASLWAACIGGAMQIDAYRETIERAGFMIDSVRVNDYRFLSESALDATEKWGVKSISLLAHRN